MDPILIVGQGLAGSILAYTLIQANFPVLVIDSDHPHSSSKVAAGIVDPLAGQRYLLAWQADQFFPEAVAFYQSLESELNIQVFYPLPMIRFFTSELDRNLWQTKHTNPRISSYFGQMFEPNWQNFNTPWGGVEIPITGYVDTRKLLAALKNWLIQKNSYRQATFNYTDLYHHANRLKWHHIQADRIIFCEGYHATQNPYFKHLPFQSVKGNIITVENLQIPTTHLLHHYKWMLPISATHVRVGPTYHRSWPCEAPQEEEKTELEEFIPTFLKNRLAGSFKIVNHQAGIRPALQTNRPVLGFHPLYPNVGIFNGLGSRGVMMAPKLANTWLKHLQGHPLPAEVALHRYAL